MRSSLATILMVAVVFGAGYWYYTAEAVCDVPISYRIGTIDDAFSISREEVRAAASQAESLWEDATGRNLFTYDDAGEVSINLIFDERQAEAEAEAHLRDELEAQQNKSENVKEQYESLLGSYEALERDYEVQQREYEAELRAYNEEVEHWNSVGGAPEDVYAGLTQQQQELEEKQRTLNDTASKLNQLANQINAIGAEGNSLIEDYNEIVEEYNTRWGGEREFTQGDYQNGSVHIYQFDSESELVIVLAHEFGHALSLGHVEGEESLMFHFMEKQSSESGATPEDTAEFERVCGDGTLTLWSILGRS